MQRHAWLILALSGTAAADPLCDRLRAEAHAEAVVLESPELTADAAHVPDVTVADPVSTASSRWQLRASAAYSFTNLLKGRAIERIAATECARQLASSDLERALVAGIDVGQLEAAKAELAVLDQHRTEIDQILADANARLAAQRAVATDVDDLRSQRTELILRAADRREAIALLEQQDKAQPLRGLVDRYGATTLAADTARADERELHPWNVDVRGGVAGSDQADWFAVLEVRYAVGGLWQGRADRAALEARQAELHQHRELAARADQVRTMLANSAAVLADEVATLDTELASLATERDRLVDQDAGRGLRDHYTMRIVGLTARRAGIAALAAARTELAR
ncbi:MAG: hypothetical protein QM831_40440 [Kofleriaceae bacterium]